MSDNLALAEGHEMLAALGVRPAYIVTMDSTRTPFSDAEWRFVTEQHGARGFTSPVADVILKNALRYDWQGRGCCIVLRVSPQGLSRAERLGLILHEAAHYVDDCDRPERDDVDHGRAVQTFWNGMGQRSRDPHGDRWLRALVHLWVRADAMGFPLGLGDTMDPVHHPCKPEQLLPLLAEADDRRGESIESILASPFPGAKVESKGVAVEPKPRRTRRHYMIFGRPTVFNSVDGSYETASSLDGTVPALRFPTYAALCEHFQTAGAV
jgi:hypothetical protein